MMSWQQTPRGVEVPAIDTQACSTMTLSFIFCIEGVGAYTFPDTLPLVLWEAFYIHFLLPMSSALLLSPPGASPEPIIWVVRKQLDDKVHTLRGHVGDKLGDA
jgi:hypothetical protein